MASMSESTLSQASTKVGDDLQEQEDATPGTRKAIRHNLPAISAEDVLLFLFAFRILNALVVRTFFQPDEYFQSLEPAWQLAFGKRSGAWITWVSAISDGHTCQLTLLQEWKTQLRSAIHPTIFAFVYRTCSDVADALKLSEQYRTELLLAAPKFAQASFAALGDYYTWKLAQRIYGREDDEAWAALAVTVFSPWQWFCSPRTLSNSLETTLTIIALYNWPWHWSLGMDEETTLQVDSQGLRIREADEPSAGDTDEQTRLRRSLLLAAIATVMRPTNILIWITLTLATMLQHTQSGWFMKIPWTDQQAWVHTTSWSMVPSRKEYMTFGRETVICGTLVLILSSLIDRFFYSVWTFPPMNFLQTNVVQGLSSFYGGNRLDYYFTEGFGLLLTTALPFAVLGLYEAFLPETAADTQSKTSKRTRLHLAIVCVTIPIILTFLSHKEVRFIYPLLPSLHILAAAPIATFFAPALTHNLSPKLRPRRWFLKRILLVTLITINVFIALYTTTLHNSGLIRVSSYLRHQHDIHYAGSETPQNLTVAFLMPCHSTPWRSHLQHPPTFTTPGISGWALTCEPPLGLNKEQRTAYLDEADNFYADPHAWLRKNMSRHPPRAKSIFGSSLPRRSLELGSSVNSGSRREWPDYLIFFEQLESVMQSALVGSAYQECWRGFNSHWHDDWRRKGDVVVWCLDRDKKRRHEDELRRPVTEAIAEWVHNRTAFLRSELSKRGADRVGSPAWQLAQHKAKQQAALGGGHGPFGIDMTAMGPKREKERAKVVPGESTVEKPFWKKREPLPAEMESLWQKVWPWGVKEKKRKGWWSGGKWT